MNVVTPFSHLTVDELLNVAYNADTIPPELGLELALRLEDLHDYSRDTLESIHLSAKRALADPKASTEVLTHLRDMSAPALPEPKYMQ